MIPAHETTPTLSRRQALRLLGGSVVLGMSRAGHSKPAWANDRPKRRILVMAHRGAHLDWPENTLPAIRAAIELGCDYVELDVRTTRDGALVLMHDDTVDRTTNGSGRVDQLTLAQIRSLHVKGGRKQASVTAGIPTLDEALAACRGKIRVCIDNKAAQPADVVAALRRHHMHDQAIIYDDPDTLRKFKQLCPSVWIQPPHPGSVEAIEQLVADLHPESLDGNIRDWTRQQVQAAHRAGTQVWVDNPWYRDNQKGIRAAVALGVDSIQTDHPARVLQLLEAMGYR